MSAEYPDNPKVTFALYQLEDELMRQKDDPHPDFVHIVEHRDQVLERFQPIFLPRHIPNLTRDEFESFLYFENNHHWTGLHRVKKFMTRDMSLLRRAIAILLDEGRPVRERLNQLRPYYRNAEDSFVSHLGIPVLTAILLIAYPDQYGVWNDTSEKGLNFVRLWDPRWDNDPSGDVYVEMNAFFVELAKFLKIDLWTLDALWWVIKK